MKNDELPNPVLVECSAAFGSGNELAAVKAALEDAKIAEAELVAAVQKEFVGQVPAQETAGADGQVHEPDAEGNVAAGEAEVAVEIAA